MILTKIFVSRFARKRDANSKTGLRIFQITGFSACHVPGLFPSEYSGPVATIGIKVVLYGIRRCGDSH